MKPRGLVLVTGVTGSGKSHRARRDDPAHQREAPRERDHDRGSDRVPAPRHQLPHQPARSRHRHGDVRSGAAPRAAPGSRRHPHRRNPRPRDARHGAQGGRHRAPGLLARCTRPTRRRRSTACCRSIRRTSRREVRFSLASALAGGRLAAPRAARRQAGPRPGVRGADQHRRGARPDPRHGRRRSTSPT